jgi:hypothetical protein
VRSLGIAVALVAAGAAADESVGEPAVAVAVRGADPHHAARLVAAAFALDVLIVGGGASVDAQLATLDGDAALARVADAAGLAVARRGTLRIVAPKDVLAALPAASARAAVSGGREIDIDFLRADAANLMRFFGDLERREIKSELRGEVTIRARRIRALDLLALLAALGRAPVRASERTITVGAGALPPAGGDTLLCDVTPAERTRMLPPPKLGCVDPDTVEVVGLAGPPARLVALVRGRMAGDKTRRAAVVRAGDRLDGTRNVRAVTPLGLDLAGLEGDAQLRFGRDSEARSH